MQVLRFTTAITSFKGSIHDSLVGISISSCPYLILSPSSLPQQRTKAKTSNLPPHQSLPAPIQPSLTKTSFFSLIPNPNPITTQWPQQCTVHLSPAPPAPPTPPPSLNHPPSPASAPSIPAMVKVGNSQPHTHPASKLKLLPPHQPSAGPNTAATREVSMSTFQLRTSSPSNRPLARRLHSRAALTPKMAKESISRPRTRAASRARYR
jgi:hypothetical protein